MNEKKKRKEKEREKRKGQKKDKMKERKKENERLLNAILNFFYFVHTYVRFSHRLVDGKIDCKFNGRRYNKNVSFIC